MSKMSKRIGKMRVEKLGLGPRTVRVLLDANIRTVGDLRSKSSLDLRKLRSIGFKSLEDIRRALDKMGSRLSGDPDVDIETLVAHDRLVSLIQPIVRRKWVVDLFTSGGLTETHVARVLVDAVKASVVREVMEE